MPRGVHKTEFEKAQDALVKQQDVVNKIQEKVDKLNELILSLEDLSDQLNVEKELLEYYGQHPVLKVSDHRDETQIREEQFEEPELPIEVPTWKGFKESHMKVGKAVTQ